MPALAGDGPESGEPRVAAELHCEVLRNEPGRRPYADAVWWAAFCFTGA